MYNLLSVKQNNYYFRYKVLRNIIETKTLHNYFYRILIYYLCGYSHIEEPGRTLSFVSVKLQEIKNR